MTHLQKWWPCSPGTGVRNLGLPPFRHTLYLIHQHGCHLHRQHASCVGLLVTNGAVAGHVQNTSTCPLDSHTAAHGRGVLPTARRAIFPKRKPDRISPKENASVLTRINHSPLQWLSGPPRRKLAPTSHLWPILTSNAGALGPRRTLICHIGMLTVILLLPRVPRASAVVWSVRSQLQRPSGRPLLTSPRNTISLSPSTGFSSSYLAREPESIVSFVLVLILSLTESALHRGKTRPAFPFLPLKITTCDPTCVTLP